MKSPQKLGLRPQVRRSPLCESLEGRQLLSGSGWAGNPHWDASATPGTTDPATVMPLSGLKDSGDHQFPGARAGLQVKGAADHTLPALSDQAKAHMQTLSSDISKLQSEVPATL